MLNQLADRADARDVRAAGAANDAAVETTSEGIESPSTKDVAPPPAPPPVKRTDYAPSPPDPSLN
jgi:hypothetical protein